MMSNLFSSFDPTTNFNFSLNWLSSFLGSTIMPFMFWMLPNRSSFLFLKCFSILHKEFKILTNSFNSTMIFILLFILILLNNFLGLFPYIFTSTSHLVMILSLALPLWSTFMIFGWMINPYHMFAQLVPQGTPPFFNCNWSPVFEFV